ncbi:hypothetical protein [Nodosilinea nodulosa]|uniref:hypothetical protein n=1 Tax=Nodosilinea nodulosa TaxID=416001 RepID=UPI00030837CC|nr:hypothetical protein [Nodosilinea nodulosa]
MACIHLVDGDKGGVGKSFVSSTLIQYFLDRSIDFIPVEADRYNPDVANRYGELTFQFAIFSDDERQTQADQLRDLAVKQPLIISLPSQVGQPLNTWLDMACFDAAENGVSFVRWFVTSGTFESLNLFQIALERHGANFPHVLVKNWGVSDDWSELSALSDLNKLMKRHKVQVIDFPRLPWQETNLVQKKNWTFAQARAAADLPSMSRTKVKRFLKEAYTAFESTGHLTDAATPKPAPKTPPVKTR